MTLVKLRRILSKKSVKASAPPVVKGVEMRVRRCLDD